MNSFEIYRHEFEVIKRLQRSRSNQGLKHVQYTYINHSYEFHWNTTNILKNCSLVTRVLFQATIFCLSVHVCKDRFSYFRSPEVIICNPPRLKRWAAAMRTWSRPLAPARAGTILPSKGTRTAKLCTTRLAPTKRPSVRLFIQIPSFSLRFNLLFFSLIVKLMIQTEN